MPRRDGRTLEGAGIVVGRTPAANGTIASRWTESTEVDCQVEVSGRQNLIGEATGASGYGPTAIGSGFSLEQDLRLF